MSVKVASCNIMDNPDIPRWKVRRAAAETAKWSDVVLYQEIGEQEDHEDIQDAMGAAYSWSGENIAIPIAWKTKMWELVERGVELMHHGLAKTSPNRYIHWVVLKRKRRFARIAKKSKIVCFMNTHFVSGAWNDKDKTNKEWRQENWGRHFAKMQARVLSFVIRGITVVFGGDFNRLAVEKFHAGQRWIVQHGIDKIGVIRGVAGPKVRVLSKGHLDVTKVHDHQMIWASLSVTAA